MSTGNTITSNVAEFNSTLARYMTFTSKLPSEALEHKGRDLSIKLYQGFAKRKWGGGGKRNPYLATTELKARTSQGMGTRVRWALKREYLQKRAALRSALARFIGPRTVKQTLSSIKQRIGLWQSFVGREIGLRQKGIGVLAASFLWFRSRSNSQGTYYVRNKTGRPLGGVERAGGMLRIFGLTEGLSEVDARYGVVANAIEVSRQDMVTYLRERHAEEYFKLFGEMPA